MAVTEEGKRTFGEWVSNARTHPDTRQRILDWLSKTNPHETVGEFATQDQFARWVTAQTGFRITGHSISRIERSASRNAPPFDAIAALINAGVLMVHGRPATLEDATSVLIGRLNPLKNGSASSTAN